MLAATSLRAQTSPQAQPVFRTGTTVVEVSAVVVDKAGNALRDLSASDFEILEDGEPRPLVAFRPLASGITPPARMPPHVPEARREVLATNAVIADAPVFVLLLDDLNTSPYNTHRAIRAGTGLLGAIPADALVGVIFTSGVNGTTLTLRAPGPEHAQRVQAFRGQLLLAGPPPRTDGPQTIPSAVAAPCGVGSAVLNSQDCADPRRAARRARTVEAIARTLRLAGARRKVIFWVTEDMGVSPLDPEGSRRAQRDALRAAVNADVAIYPVNPIELSAGVFIEDTDEQPGDDRPDRRAGNSLQIGSGARIPLATDDLVAVTLGQLARDTGGRWIRNTNDLEKVLAGIVTQNTTSYLLSYESSRAHVSGSHQIDVRVRRAGARVFARRGYAVADAPGATSMAGGSQRSAAAILRDLLHAAVPQGRIVMRLQVTPRPADARQGRAVATVHVDAGTSDGRGVELALATFDDRGRPSNQQGIRFAHPASRGVWEASLELPLARGRHQVRVAAVTDDGRGTGLVMEAVEIAGPGRELWLGAPILLGGDGGTRQPTLTRTIDAGQPLAVQADVGGRPVADGRVTVAVTLLDASGTVVREAPAVLEAGGSIEHMRAIATMPTEGLAAGPCALVIEARARGDSNIVRRAIPIELAPIGPPSRITALDPVPVVHGPITAHDEAAQMVIRSRDEWDAFWKALPTRQPLPAIDFERVLLVAIVVDTGDEAYEEPRIDSARVEDGTLVVRWRTATAERPSSLAPGTRLRPFVVAGVIGFRGAVRFAKIQ